LAIFIDQSTQTEIKEEEEEKSAGSSKQTKGEEPKDEESQTAEVSKRSRVVKKKRSSRDASVQTSVSTTVPSPALRQVSRNVPLLIAREEATQTLDERRLLRDASSHTEDLH
jgi:hypothetical protein